ncbi:unnamed protein product [Blepharisma stoltei]|uniref:Uncharacterized protein n=1 Tax=Blepharisma stoltei TaxID=1481888 RepID=A0AAU9JBJ0_9CILI|nr:unnamed protein product [Blepharisma stoltei]
MRKSEASFNEMQENEKPSSLVSLQISNRKFSDLKGIEKYKNLAELDLSGNSLIFAVPQLFSLKFLKKLILASNQIESLWPLPTTLEHLDISDNFLISLNTVLPELTRLQSLDISNNYIETLSPLSTLTHLKSLSASSNKIKDLSGIENLNMLLEVEVDNNMISLYTDLEVLKLNSSISVINLKNNPILHESRDEKFRIEFPSCFTELKEGIFYRHPENLKELKTSKYRSLIRKHKKSDQFFSPDWGSSRRSSKHGSSCASFREVYDQIICEDPSEEKILNESMISIESAENDKSPEIIISILDLDKEEVEFVGKKNNVMISKLPLDKISDKPSYEKWSTKPDSSLEALFEELISYYGLEEPDIHEFSFSNEKYEHVVSILKEREDERKSLLSQTEMLKSKINELERSQEEFFQEKLEKAKEIKSLKKQLKELRKTSEKNIQDLYEETAKLKLEKDTISTQMFESQNLLMKKIREIEVEHEFSKRATNFNSSMEECQIDGSRALLSHRFDSSFMVTKEMSFCQYQNSDRTEALVNKEVGDYIQKLLKKISTQIEKLKKVRAQRDKLKQFYDKHKNVI